MSQVKKALVAALTLLLVVTCATAAGFSSFKILASKAVLETITPADGEVKHVNLQSSYMIEVRCVPLRRLSSVGCPSSIIPVAVPSPRLFRTRNSLSATGNADDL